MEGSSEFKDSGEGEMAGTTKERLPGDSNSASLPGGRLLMDIPGGRVMSI
jgi:hypothetical protein